MRLGSRPDPPQHVRTDRGIVHVRCHCTAGQIFEDGECEGVSHGVDEYIWRVLECRLHAQHHRAQTLAEHGKVRVPFSHDPATSTQDHKVDIRFADLHIESVLGLFQDVPGRGLYITRVHDDLELPGVSVRVRGRLDRENGDRIATHFLSRPRMAHQSTRSPPPPALQYGWKKPMWSKGVLLAVLCNRFFLLKRTRRTRRADTRNDNRPMTSADNNRRFILEGRVELLVCDWN